MTDSDAESTVWRDVTVFCSVFLGVYLLSGFWAGPSTWLNLLAACLGLVGGGAVVFALRTGVLGS